MTDWRMIHLLEGRLWYHRNKDHYRREKLIFYQRQGQTEHYWLDLHKRKGEKAAAEKVWGEILKTRKEIIKWKDLLTPEEVEVHRLEARLRELRPKGQWWPMGGWVRPGEPNRMQRQDQGQDFEIPIYHSVVAPGHGVCTGYASDGPFPAGFGTPYATVKIYDGLFGGESWYLGHANEPIIRPGQSFVPGQPLSRLNHSLNQGWGWIELGHLPYGSMNEGERWHHLFRPVWKA